MFSLLFEQPFVFMTWVIAFLVALSVHEFCHALMSTWLGDSTAKRLGRLTLNPAAHVDPLGFLAVLFIGFGWGKPVPFNPYNLRLPKWGPTLVAFAGPASNLILAIISAVGLTLVGPRLGCANLLTGFLFISMNLNIALMVFNLIPLPPLDGSKALLAVLAHPRHAALRTLIEERGQMILLGFILIDSFLHLGILAGAFAWASGLLSHVIPFSCAL